MIRTLNILGLFLTTVGALLLLRFSPIAMMVTADGGGRPYWDWSAGSIAATLIFVSGFILTLFAILRTKG